MFVYFFFSHCVCVRVLCLCVCVWGVYVLCMFAHAWVHMEVWGWCRESSSITIPPCALRQGLLIKPRALWDDCSPQGLYSENLPSEPGITGRLPYTPDTDVGSGDLNSGPHACTGHFSGLAHLPRLRISFRVFYSPKKLVDSVRSFLKTFSETLQRMKKNHTPSQTLVYDITKAWIIQIILNEQRCWCHIPWFKTMLKSYSDQMAWKPSDGPAGQNWEFRNWSSLLCWMW